MTTSTFDPVAFKETTRAQWQAAAAAWHRWGPFIGDWLGEATETMLDLAGIGEGSRVLDVAAGAGEQSLRAARRVGADGYVLATDISPRLLALAADEADAAGVRQVATAEIDGENLEALAPGQFDAAVSRVGLIYFPNRRRALEGMVHCLRPGGRVSAVVYSTPEVNDFFATPIRIIRERAALPPPVPGQPGPFSLGAPGALQAAYAEAGLIDINVSVVPSPVRLPTAAECVRFERESFGALHQMMAPLDETAKAETWAEIEQALRAYETPQGFVGPCEMLVGVGTKPA